MTAAYPATAGSRLARGILVSLALMTGTLATGAAGGQEVIVNADVDLNAIDRNFARLLITMRMPQWPDKRPVTVFVLPDNNPVHESFAKRVLEVYPYQLRRTWDRQVFSGTGQAPRQVANEQEMIERVSQTAGAVGYVSSPPDTGLVKVLEVEQ
jgi:hypothetical protein